MKNYKKIFTCTFILLLSCVTILFFNIDYDIFAAFENKIKHNVWCDISIITAALIVGSAILLGVAYFIMRIIKRIFFKAPAEESTSTFSNDYTSNLALTNALIQNIKDDMGPNKQHKI